MPLGLVFPDNGAHLSPFLARLCHGQICPTSCQPSEPRFSLLGAWIDGRPTLRWVFAALWQAPGQPLAGIHQPGRGLPHYAEAWQAQVAKIQFQMSTFGSKSAFPGIFDPWIFWFEGRVEQTQCCGLHRALYEPHGRREVQRKHLPNRQCHD